jgi:hypothetical protein
LGNAETNLRLLSRYPAKKEEEKAAVVARAARTPLAE